MSTSKRTIDNLVDEENFKKVKFNKNNLNDNKATVNDLDTSQDLENKKFKKGSIKTEGYDSDSSNEGNETLIKNRYKNDNNDDDDMFGDNVDTNRNDNDNDKKQKTQLKLGDIEGQEFGGLGDKREHEYDDDNNSQSYSSGEDEDEEEQMGGKLSAFNMREEMEQGKFVDDGTYIENSKDPHEMHDAWIDESDKSTRKKVREAHRQRLKQEQEQYERSKALNAQGGRKEECMIELAEMTNKGESVLEALQRFGKLKDKSKKLNKDEQKKSSENVERFTSLINILGSMGINDIYDWEHEWFIRNLKKSGYVKDDWKPKWYGKEENGNNREEKEEEECYWEYKQSPNYINTLPPEMRPIEVQVFGPFKSNDIKNWIKRGHFGPNGSFIKLRKVENDNMKGQWIDCDKSELMKNLK